MTNLEQKRHADGNNDNNAQNNIDKGNSSNTTDLELQQLIEKIEKNPQILNEVPKEIKFQILRHRVTQHMHAGPLPPPEYLRDYNDIIPGAAERIMAMAETEQKHTHQMDKTTAKYSFIQFILGQIFAFTIGIFAIAAAAYCLLKGHGWPAAIFGIGGIATIIRPFLSRARHEAPPSATEKGGITEKKTQATRSAKRSTAKPNKKK